MSCNVLPRPVRARFRPSGEWAIRPTEPRTAGQVRGSADAALVEHCLFGDLSRGNRAERSGRRNDALLGRAGRKARRLDGTGAGKRPRPRLSSRGRSGRIDSGRDAVRRFPCGDPAFRGGSFRRGSGEGGTCRQRASGGRPRGERRDGRNEPSRPQPQIPGIVRTFWDHRDAMPTVQNGHRQFGSDRGIFGLNHGQGQ